MTQAVVKPLKPAVPRDEAAFGRRVSAGTAIGISVFAVVVGFLFLLVLPQPAGFGGSGVGSGRGQGVGDGAGDSRGQAEMTQEGSAAENIADSKTGQDQVGAGDRTAEAGSDSVPRESDRPAAEAPIQPPVNRPKPAPLKFALNPIPIEPEPEQNAGQAGLAGKDAQGLFEGRSVEQRQKLVEEEGGSPASEAAVELGLKWLAAHQSPDGHWSLHQFRTPQCRTGCSHPGSASDTAGTALGVLPFLGAGYTHRHGPYQRQVNAALDWLVQDQNKDGSFRSLGGGSMYAHAQATIALCEALALTHDKALQRPAQNAVNFIVAAQDKRGGGWRYHPGEPGDTSVVGWQVLALKSARQASLKVSNETLEQTSRFLNSVQSNKLGATYGYMPGHGMSIVMTAEGLLCRMYTGWKRGNLGLKEGVAVLLQSPPARHRDFYYWYYATQVMHHYGDEPWDKWNPQMRGLLIDLQAKQGHEAGSWGPQGGHDGAGGRVYTTSLALLTLEVYYRHKRLY